MSETSRLLRASKHQHRLWVDTLRHPESTAYRMVFVHRIRGPLDVSRLHAAVQAMADAQEGFRCTFHSGADSHLHLQLHTQLPVRLTQVAETAEPDAFARRIQQASLDLTRDSPIHLGIASDGEQHVVALCIHHVAFDGVQVPWIYAAITAAYAGEAIREVPSLTSYLDSVDEADPGAVDAVDAVADALESWPLDSSVEAVPHEDDGSEPTRVIVLPTPDHLATTLRERARAMGVTRFTLIAAAWLATLSRYTGPSRVLSTYAVRDAPRALADMAATLVDSQGLGAHIERETPLSEVVAQVAEAREAYDPRVDYSALVRALRRRGALAGHEVLARTGVASTHLRWVPWTLPGLEIEPVDPPPADALWDLLLEYGEVRGLRFRLTGRASRYPAWFCEQLGGHYLRMLQALVDTPDQAVAAVPILDDDQRRAVLIAPNQTQRAYPRERTVADLLEASLAAHATQVAVWDGGTVYRYADLEPAARGLAVRIRRFLGEAHRPGMCVAFRCPTGWPSVVAMAGIVLADCAYLPLSTADPPARHAAMLAHAHALVCSEDDVGPDVGLIRIPFGRDDGPLPARSSTATAPVYRMTTSGSTGVPKATEIPHRGVVRLLFGTTWREFVPTDRLLQASDLAFDAATFEVWGALLHGATLVCPDRGVLLDSARLRDLLAAERISAMFLTAGLFHRHAETDPAMFASLDMLFVGGDVVDPLVTRRVLEHGPPANLYNGYGPTENTTFSTVHRIDGRQAPLPIGRPIANSTCTIVDRAGGLVPMGVPGELVVGGDGVALGYAGDPERTDARFADDSHLAEIWGDEATGRTYRTGDRARWRPDGQIDFLGRIDDQVKIRGFRVEPGEVEARLRSHPGVLEAVVVVRREPRGAMLVAFYAADTALDAVELRAFLAERIPDYAIPAQLCRLDALPIGRTGKVDRKVLAAQVPSPVAPPATDEVGTRALASVWRQVLGQVELDPQSSFFEVGGDSLTAIELAARVRQELGRDLAVDEVFAIPRLGAMAEHIRRRGPTDLPEPVPSGTPAPPTLALSHYQHTHWLMIRNGRGMPTASAVRVDRVLDADELQHAWSAVLARHEVPWLTVDRTQPQLVRHPPTSSPVRWLDPGTDAAAAVHRGLADLVDSPFTDDVPAVHLLASPGSDHTALAIFGPHALLDGFAIQLLFTELIDTLRGAPPPAPALPLHDYLAWEQQTVTPDRIDKACDFYERTLVGDAVMRLPKQAMDATTRGAGATLDPTAVHALAQLAKRLDTTLEAVLTHCAFLAVHLAFDKSLVRCLSAYNNRDLLALRRLPTMLANGVFQQSELDRDATFVDQTTRFAADRVATFRHAQLPPIVFFGMSRLLFMRRRLAHLPLATWFGRWWAGREAHRHWRVGAYLFDLAALSVVYVLWRKWMDLAPRDTVPTVGCFINVTTSLRERPPAPAGWGVQPLRAALEIPESVPGNPMLELYRDADGVQVFFQGRYVDGVCERFVALLQAVVARAGANPDASIGVLVDALAVQGRSVFRRR